MDKLPNDNLALDDDLQVHDTCDHYLIPAQPTGAVIPADVEAIITQQVMLAQQYQRMIAALLLLTKAHDWTRYGNKFRLTAAGATKVAQSFGLFLSSPNVETERWQDNGLNYVRFTLTGTVRAANYPHEIPIVGSAEGAPNGKGYMKTDSDIRKKAAANYTQRGITAIIGIGDITIEDLLEAGKTQSFIDQIPIVSFKESAEAKQNTVTRQNALADDVRALGNEIVKLSGGSLQDVITEASLYTIPSGKDAGKTVHMDANKLDQYKDGWLSKTKLNLEQIKQQCLEQELPPFGDEGDLGG